HHKCAKIHRRMCDDVAAIGHEFEVLRIDLRKGSVKQATPQVDSRLLQLEERWQQNQLGNSAGRLDAEVLVRALVVGLEVARELDSAQEDWGRALQRTEKILDILRKQQRPAHDVAIDRMNRA